MPQVKGLKELKLLVSNEKETGRYGGSAGCRTVHQLPSYLPSLVHTVIR